MNSASENDHVQQGTFINSTERNVLQWLYAPTRIGKTGDATGGWFVGPFSCIVFFAFYFGFFDMDFGLKGNILGSMGATAGITIGVTAFLYRLGQNN